MSDVYQYDVEIKIQNKSTGEYRTVTRTEWGYSAIDALAIAHMNTVAEQDSQSWDIGLVRISPAREHIDRATDKLRDEIDKTVERLTRVQT